VEIIPSVPSEESEKEDWSLDTSVEAQKARRAEFLAAQLTSAAKLRASEEENESAKPETILKNFIKSTTDVVAISAELDRLQLKLGLTNEERLRVILAAAIDLSSPKTIVTQFGKRAALLKKVMKDASGVLLITSIERLLDNASHVARSQDGKMDDSKTSHIARIGLVLQKLYETDVLTEDSILTWARSSPDASIWAVSRDVATSTRKYAKSFVEWLQSAEDEEE